MHSGATSLFIWWIGWGVWPLIALIILPGSSFFIDDMFSIPLYTILDWLAWGMGLLSTVAAIIFVTKLSKHQSRMRPR